MRTQVATPLGSQRYLIERELGRGGMGVVYQAFDQERGARVALKALTHSDALNIYRLKNEFRQLSDLCHPNLVSLHELCCDAEQWFFTMELIDGVTFDEYVGVGQHAKPPSERGMHTTLAGRARLVRDASVTLSQTGIASHFALPRLDCDLTRLRSALSQLVAGIAALHDAGKLHRDIKPSNVLVTHEGRVVILDFGLVSNGTRIDPEIQDPDRTIGGTVFGTPAYMSPEQASGEQVTTASDWYSVGCILYETLTGRLPFEGSVLQILKQKEELEPPPPSSIVSGVPEDLDQLCRSLLHRNPDDRPAGDDVRRYFMGSSVPPPLRDSVPENRSELFIGREPHLATLRAAFERTKARQTSVVFVHGYSGMGKSALVRCLANDLIKRSEALVLRGRCYERESVPYKAFDDIIDALSRHMMRLPTEEASELLPRNVHSLARLFPVLKRVRAVAHARLPLHQTEDPLEMRNQAFGALKDLLLRLSDWQPLVINIDDLQWADMDSARLLSYLLGPPDPPPLMFVGVYRREEAGTSAFLRHVLADTGLNGGDVQQLAVDPLSMSEATQLTRELLSSHPLADALFMEAISAESEGVPFFIGELARHLREQTQRWPKSLASVALPDVIAARVEALTPAARVVLEVLSVAARPLEQGVVLEAARLPSSDRAALQELRTARMVRTRGTRQTDYAETYHDRVRETVVERLTAERTREIHAWVARASENWGVGEPEQLVVHYTEAGEGGRAGETAIHAARVAAEKLAFDRAADLYRKAIELLPTVQIERHQQLLVELGDALAHAGRGSQAAEAYLRAARGSDGIAAQRLQRKAAQQLLASGRFDAGYALATRLLEDIGYGYVHSGPQLLAAYAWTRTRIALRGFDYTPRPASSQDDQVAETLQTLSSLFREMSGYDTLIGAVLQGRFLLAALDAGDEAAILQGLVWECFHLSLQGGARNLKRAKAVLEFAKELSDKQNTPFARATYDMALTAFLMFGRGRYRDAFAAACEGQEILRTQCPGYTWESTFMASLKCIAVEYTGDLSLLLREAPQRERDAADRDDRYSLGLLIQSVPLTHLMRDDPASAMAFIVQQEGKLGDRFSTLHYFLMLRTAGVLLYEGRGKAAHELVSERWGALTQTLLFRSRVTRASAHLLRARCALMAFRETGESRYLAAIERDRTVVNGLGAGYSGFGPALAGQVALLKNDRAEAQACFESALGLFSAEQSEHAVQYVQYRLGEILADSTGERLKAEATRLLSHQGVSNVPRWVASFVPIEPSF
jgi:serine/threonine protein kinase/tetratricopeptide (TPR) repeat protein